MHVLQRGVDVADIVNMAAIAVVDAQEKARAEPPRRHAARDARRVRDESRRPGSVALPYSWRRARIALLPHRSRATPARG